MPDEPTPADDVTKRIAEIRARCERATKGPWYIAGEVERKLVAGMTDTEFDDEFVAIGAVPHDRHTHFGETPFFGWAIGDDLRFTVNARDDVPWLLTQLEAERARRERAEGDIDADGTDAAHPAWWRGHNNGVECLCQRIDGILAGKDDGRGVANGPWESTRRELLALVVRCERAEAVAEAVRAYDSHKEWMGEASFDGRACPTDWLKYDKLFAEKTRALAAYLASKGPATRPASPGIAAYETTLTEAGAKKLVDVIDPNSATGKPTREARSAATRPAAGTEEQA